MRYVCGFRGAGEQEGYILIDFTRFVFVDTWLEIKNLWDNYV